MSRITTSAAYRRGSASRSAAASGRSSRRSVSTRTGEFTGSPFARADALAHRRIGRFLPALLKSEDVAAALQAFEQFVGRQQVIRIGRPADPLMEIGRAHV